ncbi:MAG: alpha/beta hydrolase [Rhizobiaceae bacterium]
MRSFFLCKIFSLSCLTMLLATSSPAFAQSANSVDKRPIEIAKKKSFVGDVVFVRGGFNVFSTGLDQMAKKLARRGVSSRIAQHTETSKTVSEIVRHQKKYGRKPVILIGHSWGANEVIHIARALQKKRIRVNYMVVFAATNPPPIPRNVQKTTNYYFKTNGWGKPVRRGRGTRGSIRNIDLSNVSGMNHFNVEESPKIQRQVIQNILRYIRRRGKV